MRYSKQRELILKKVAALDDHPTAEEIHRVASEDCPGLSLGTVYRNLNSLAEAGLVRKVAVPGGADRFDHTLCQHSHFCCTRCGGVTDAELDEQALMRLIGEGEQQAVGYELTLFGLCRACRREQAV